MKKYITRVSNIIYTDGNDKRFQSKIWNDPKIKMMMINFELKWIYMTNN